MSSRKPFCKLTRQGKRKRLRKMSLDGVFTEENNGDYSSDQGENSDCNEELSDNDNQSHHLRSDSSDSITLCSDVNQSRAIRSSPSHEGLPQSLFDVLDKCGASSSNESEDDNFVKENENEQLQRAIRNWSVKFAVTNVALSALLVILKSHSCFKNLPLDARTLKETPTSTQLKTVHPGNYCHIGIAYSLQKIWSMVVECITSIELFVGIDGLPLFSSNSSELWPILGSVVNIPSIKSQVFPIGIYHGKGKPSCPTEFLSSFVDEVVDLINNGLELNGKKISVVLKGICCDAPAKAFILGVKSHTGYSSCTRCKQVGSWINNRMSFPEDGCETRTHLGFLNKEDEGFHVRDSPLTQIPGLDLVSSFPLDYMHLVCLGVMRTMLLIWVSGKPPFKFQSSVISTISSRLIALQNCIPFEFCRKPRSLSDLKRWKATEFRQFIIYTGPLVLISAFMPDHLDIYNLFISLHVSMTILLSPSLCRQHQTYAKELLQHFVKSFEATYGSQFITHNFHGLTHISDDVTHFGPLDICSAFKFESFLHTLKKLVRKGDKPLQQVVNRLNEMFKSDIKFHPFSKSNTFLNNKPNITIPCFMNPHSLGPVWENCDPSRQFKSANFLSFRLSNSRPNNCCSLSDGSIVLILNFIFSYHFNSMVILCRKFEKVNDFYGDPFCPSSSLGIFNVSQLSVNTYVKKVSEIKNKMVFLSLDDYSIAVPLLHSE